MWLIGKMIPKEGQVQIETKEVDVFTLFEQLVEKNRLNLTYWAYGPMNDVYPTKR